MDNDEDFGHPEYMSSAGPSTSARFLAKRPAAPGWTGSTVFGLRDGSATKGKLKVNFKKADKDSVLLTGSFATEDAPTLGDQPRENYWKGIGDTESHVGRPDPQSPRRPEPQFGDGRFPNSLAGDLDRTGNLA